MRPFCACGAQFATLAGPILRCDIISHALTLLTENHQQLG